MSTTMSVVETVFDNCRQSASDTALIRAIASGDRRAMQMLYTRHYVRVTVYPAPDQQPVARRGSGSEVFLDVWRQAESFKAKSLVSTWLLGIARYKALSALRRRSDEHLDDDALAMIEDPADDAETLVEKEDCRAIVQHCLAQLSPAHREVLDLVYYHEKSVNEAAEIVGIPANTVKTRMFYARTCMEKFLKLAGVDAF